MILRGWETLWELKRPSSRTGEQWETGRSAVTAVTVTVTTRTAAALPGARCAPNLCVCIRFNVSDTPASRPPKSPHFMYEEIEAQGGGWPMLG